MTEKMMSEKKKDTVRIAKKSLLSLLSENERMTQQITELQTRMTELVEENRILKGEKLPLPDKVAAPLVEDLGDLTDPFPQYIPSFPRQDIYFDGSNK